MTLLKDRQQTEMHPVFERVSTATEWLYGIIGAFSSGHRRIHVLHG